MKAKGFIVGAGLAVAMSVAAPANAITPFNVPGTDFWDHPFGSVFDSRSGLDLDDATMAEILAVDNEAWRAEIPQIEAHLAKFGDQFQYGGARLVRMEVWADEVAADDIGGAEV